MRKFSLILIVPDNSVGGRVGRAHLDATDTLAFDDSELDVTLVTPVGVPGVLNEPVIQAGS